MSEISNALVDAIRQMQDDQTNEAGPQMLTWSGNDYPCAIGAAQTGRALGFGGWNIDLDLQVAIVLDDFENGTPTAKRSKITVNGTVYRVEHTITPPQGGVMVLGLISDTKGI